jgi:hypothetical protein
MIPISPAFFRCTRHQRFFHVMHKIIGSQQQIPKFILVAAASSRQVCRFRARTLLNRNLRERVLRHNPFGMCEYDG